jgi:viologen exporter family transport system permease protein
VRRAVTASLALWRVAVQRDLEFRGNFFLSIVLSLLVFGTGLLVAAAFFDGGRTFRGWDFIDMLLLFGIYQIVDGFVRVFFRPSLSIMSEYVRSGQLEYILTRPIDAQLHISFFHVDIWSSPTLVLGVGTVAYVFSVSGVPPAVNVLAGIVCLMSGITICYAITLMINTLSIWVVRVSTGNALFGTVLNLSRFPMQGLPDGLAFIFVWVVPIFFITTAPTLVLRGDSPATLVPLSLGLAALFVICSRLLFLRALRSFSGAGG